MPPKAYTQESLSAKIKQDYKIWDRDTASIIAFQNIDQLEYEEIEESFKEFRENFKALQRLAGDTFDTNHADIIEISSKIKGDLMAIRKLMNPNTPASSPVIT